MYLAMDRIDYLAYWVVSDHFEELGRPPSLFHGGFGLLTVGNLRKPRYWALRMLEMLGPDRLAIEVKGDGAESLVQAIATSGPDHRVDVLAWNGTLDQTKQAGARLLDRTVRLQVRGLSRPRYRLEHLRLDERHSNILRHWREAGAPDWPDAAGWRRLQAADHLDSLEPAKPPAVDGGQFEMELELPMPSASLLRLLPEA